MANLRPENADFGLEKAEMSSWRADLRPRNALRGDMRPEMENRKQKTETEDEETRIFLYGIIGHHPLQVLQ